MEEGVKSKWSSYENINKCHFDDFRSTILYITLFNSDKSCIVVIYIEYNDFLKFSVDGENSGEKYKQETYTINMSPVRLDHDKMKCIFSSFNKYLIFWQRGHSSIIYMDMFKDTLFIKKEMDHSLLNVVHVPNKDDVIAQMNESIEYIKLNYIQQQAQLDVFQIKEYKTKEFNIKIDKEFFIVNIESENFIEIFKLFELQHLVFTNSHTLTNTNGYCVSDDARYLVQRTFKNELVVVDFVNMKQVASLQLNDAFYQLTASNKYISLTMSNGGHYMSFKIL